MTNVQTAKVAVVSGGAGYVGSAIATRLASDGFTVAVLSLLSPGTSLPSPGCRVYQCDLTDAAAVERTIGTIEKELGSILVCVHAAGNPPKPKRLYESSLEDLREQFEPDVFGAFNFLATCARRLKEHRAGVLIGITTAAVATAANTHARGAYSPVKFAQQGMLAAFKEELSPSGIRVYSVAPGVMPGGLNRGTPQAFLDLVRERGPRKTLAQASDVAAEVSFLASDDSCRITDLTILVAPETETR